MTTDSGASAAQFSSAVTVYMDPMGWLWAIDDGDPAVAVEEIPASTVRVSAEERSTYINRKLNLGFDHLGELPPSVWHGYAAADVILQLAVAMKNISAGRFMCKRDSAPITSLALQGVLRLREMHSNWRTSDQTADYLARAARHLTLSILRGRQSAEAAESWFADLRVLLSRHPDLLALVSRLHMEFVVASRPPAMATTTAKRRRASL